MNNSFNSSNKNKDKINKLWQTDEKDYEFGDGEDC
jgi:hypothetical protein